MSLVISSTTDSQEAVNAAAGIEEPEVTDQKPTQPVPLEDPDTEDEEDEQEPEEDDSAPAAKQKPKGGFQRKIEKLATLSEQREAKIRELEETVRRLAQPQQPQTQQGPPRPEDFPNDYEAYNRAIIRYEARQEIEQELKARVDAQRQAAEQRAQQEIDQRWHSNVGALKKEAADFEEALESVSHIPVMPWLQAAIKRDKDGARLAYELARHPDEFQRIAEIPDPLEALSALGEFRGSLKAATATPRMGAEADLRASARKVASEAPAPIRPVGQSSSGTRVNRPIDELPYQDYKRAREQMIKARKSR